MSSNAPSAAGLFLTRDLFFASKVTGTAQALGLRIELEREPEKVPPRIAAEGFRLLIVDLEVSPIDLAALVSRIEPRESLRIIAFGPHVNAERLAAARAAGCDDVMPRSRFSAELPQILRDNLTQGTPPT